MKYIAFFLSSLLLPLLAVAETSSPYISRVWEYCPAPGQFVNELPEYENGDNANDMRLKAEEAIADNNRGMITLGGWGGYVVFGFDHMVKNVPGQYDFVVLGNAFYSEAGYEENGQKGGSSEPAIVMVSYDANGNGRPDDEWYELAGSEYSNPATRHNYSVTYSRPAANHQATPSKINQYLIDTTYIPWQTSESETGYIIRNVYHTQPYYPEWIADDQLTFSGSRLPDNYRDESGNGTYYVLYPYDWGYADNHPNQSRKAKLKIDWAVREDGTSVQLPGIHFVKVYTAVHQNAGWLGETSAEIMGANDLHLLPEEPEQPEAADSVVLDLSSVLNNYEQTADGCWANTYMEGNISTDWFLFSHTGTANAGGGMSYWAGFTVCTSGDNANYGAEGSSDGWLTHQWGCMAGGGLDEQYHVGQGLPYLVGYWGFMEEQLDEDYHSLRVDFQDNKMHRPLGVYICNHPWPYYGNINGDGFASAFTQEGDYFALVAHGLDAEGQPTGSTVRLELAAFRDGQLVQSADWQYFDLRPLGAVSGLYFTMETSDIDLLYGANTAVFFCLDRLSMEADEALEPLQRPTNLQVTEADETTLTLTWTAVEGATFYQMYLDGVAYATTEETSFVFSGLLPDVEYSLGVAAAAEHSRSDKASVTARTVDLTSPSVPSGLHATPAQYSILLEWNPSTDNVGVSRYTVYVNGEAYKRTSDTECRIVGLDPATEYILEVDARDRSGNISARASLTVTTTDETALDQITTDTAPAKIVRNGQIYIIRNGRTYTLTGNKITEN